MPHRRFGPQWRPVAGVRSLASGRWRPVARPSEVRQPPVERRDARMRLGLHLPHWGLGPRTEGDSLTLAQEAERLGFAVVWAPEAYGSDAVTVLTWIAAHTSRIDVGSAVLQIPARSGCDPAPRD